jgi:hypothetical protein
LDEVSLTQLRAEKSDVLPEETVIDMSRSLAKRRNGLDKFRSRAGSRANASKFAAFSSL